MSLQTDPTYWELLKTGESVMSDKSLKFIEYMEFTAVSLEDMEGAVNAKLEELQKIPNVRIDYVHTKPLIWGESIRYFVQITGRRIIRTQRPRVEPMEETMEIKYDTPF